MHTITVGEKYSGPIPQQDGLHFEIGPDGDMQMVIQVQSPSPTEKKALQDGFRQYSLYRHPGDIVLACWVFKFSTSFGYMDAPFYAGLYQDGRVQKFLDIEQNLLTVTILDGEIVQGLRAVGLHPVAMKEFKSIVREQQPVDRAVYDAAVDSMYHMDSRELFNRGLQFSHRETKQ